MIYMKPIFCGLGGLIIGVVIGYVLWLFVILVMGAGHGTYLPAKLLFPYTMAATRWTHHISGTAIDAGMAAYAGYGAVLGYGLPTAQRKRIALVVLGFHGLAVLVALVLTHSAF